MTMTKHAVAILAMALTVALVAAACVEKSKRLSKNEKDMLAEIVTKTPGKPQHALDIQFGKKVALLGYDVSRSTLREGESFTVTWYWQVKEPLGEGWKLFTHLADSKQESRVNLDAVRPVRELYPVEQWKKGDFILDRQEVTLPEDWKSSAAIFYLGFWDGKSKRLPITAGAKDNQDRAIGLRLPVTLAKSAPKDVPRLIARHLTSALKIDGKLNEPDWVAAQPSAHFVQTMTGAAGAFEAGVRVLYDAEKLYIGYVVEDDFLKCTFAKHDDHLWEQDVVEVMVDPDGDEKNYFEIQVSPSGLVFDTRYDTRRSPRPFGGIAWSSQAQAKVSLDGTLNDDDDDEGYTVELAIPWVALSAGPLPAAPPAKGATWRMNFFVMDARDSGQRAVGWSAPLIGDFHTLDRFGRVIFPEAAVPAPIAPTK